VDQHFGRSDCEPFCDALIVMGSLSKFFFINPEFVVLVALSKVIGGCDALGVCSSKRPSVAYS
jgi:hypothetical protein